MDRLSRRGTPARYPGRYRCDSDDIAMAGLPAAAIYDHVATEFARGVLMPDGQPTAASALGDRPALGGSA